MSESLSQAPFSPELQPPLPGHPPPGRALHGDLPASSPFGFDGAVSDVAPGASVDVAVGVADRVENCGTAELVFIEVQHRTYSAARLGAASSRCSLAIIIACSADVTRPGVQLSA